MRLKKRSAAGEIPPPRLLGAFDPLLLGWVSRHEIIGEHTTLVTRNGMFHPFVLVDGRAVGRWSFAKGAVSLKPFEPVPRQAAAALEMDAADVARFLTAH